jgi:hypothetical protein
LAVATWLTQGGPEGAEDSRMKRLIPMAAVAAALVALSGCYYYGDRYGYYHHPYYGGYYDDYYGPYNGGYWGDDGYYYYYDANRHEHRDSDRHFRRDQFEGGHEFRDEDRDRD